MKMKIETPLSQNYGTEQKYFSEEVYSDTSLLQQTRKSQLNNLTLHLRQPDKEEQIKHKIIRNKS